MKKLLLAMLIGMYVGCTSCTTYITTREPIPVRLIQEDQTWSLEDFEVIYLMETLTQMISGDDDDFESINIRVLSEYELEGRWGQCWIDGGDVYIDFREDIPFDWLHDVALHEFAHAAVFLSDAEDTSDHGPLWASFFGLFYRNLIGE